jgi:hypothetical protein
MQYTFSYETCPAGVRVVVHGGGSVRFTCRASTEHEATAIALEWVRQKNGTAAHRKTRQRRVHTKPEYQR